MRIETEEQKKSRIFEHYKQYIKKPVKKQEKVGISPRYAWRDGKTGEPITPPGWLVWSTYADGVGVVYRRNDGKIILIAGWQGNFCYM